MADTEKERKQQVIKDVLAERQPSTPLAHAVVFALLSAQEGVTQKEYAEAIGLSDRSIRKYIAQHKAEYEAEFKRAEAELRQLQGRSRQKEMTGTQIDAFMDILIEKATSDTGTTQDRKLLIEFTGLNGADLIQRNAVKKSTLRWFILNNLSTLSSYLNTREMGINIEETDLLNREDKESENNVQNFTDSSIFSDPAFLRECAYFGLLFLSIYNEVEHPDLLLLGDAVRLERILDGRGKTDVGLGKASRYAKAKDYYKRTEPYSDDEMRAMLTELYSGPTSKLTQAEIEAQVNSDMRKLGGAAPAFNSLKNIETPAREAVAKRVTEAEDLLEVRLNATEWLNALNKRGIKKEY